MFKLLAGVRALRVWSHEEEEDWDQYIKPRQEKDVSQEKGGQPNKLHPLVFWDPAPVTFGDPLTKETCNAYCKDFKTRVVEGSFHYHPGPGDVPPAAGPCEIVITFVPNKKHKYVSVSHTQTLTVKRRPAEVAWDVPISEMQYGCELDQSFYAGVSCKLTGGRFNYSHPLGSQLAVGTHTVRVQYEPSVEDSADYARGYATYTFPVVGVEVPLKWPIPFSADSYAHFTKHVTAMANTDTLVAEYMRHAEEDRLLKEQSEMTDKQRLKLASPVRKNVSVSKKKCTGAALSPQKAGTDKQLEPSTPTSVSARGDTDTGAGKGEDKPGELRRLSSKSKSNAFTIDSIITGSANSRHNTRTEARFTPQCSVVVNTLPTRKRSSAFFAGAPIIYPEPLPPWLYEAKAEMWNAEMQESEYVEGEYSYDPPVGTQLPTGAHTIRLTFTPLNLHKYRVTLAQREVRVLPSPVPLDWPQPIGMTHGELLDDLSLTCRTLLDVPGNFTYDPPQGAALSPGRHELCVLFEPLDPVNYHAACTSVSFQVRPKRVPKLQWADPPDIVHPWPLTRLQLDAACRGGRFFRGELRYDPPLGCVLDAGEHLLGVTFLPELATAAQVWAHVPITVHQGMSRLIWNTPEALHEGEGLYAATLNCVCSNLQGGTFTYDPPEGTVVQRGVLKVTCRYTPDNCNYSPAETYVKVQVLPRAVVLVSKYYQK